MRYADTLLIDGEDIALRTRQHWLALVITARYGFLLWLLGLGLMIAVPLLNLDGAAAQMLAVGALLAFGVGLVIFLIRLWQWWAQDYLITSRRLMKVWGVFNKRSVDSALEKINDARLDQSLFGRIFDYGHLDILTASTETDLDDYDMIRDPKGFKKVMLTQKHALEMFYYRGAPSPPLRAEMTMNGEPLPPPVVPPPAPDTPAATQPVASDAGPLTEAGPARDSDATADTARPASGAISDPAAQGAPGTASARAVGAGDASLEITQTLARLADLRDRGAITEADFEDKKRELLDRL
jgi:hypothetical protein